MPSCKSQIEINSDRQLRALTLDHRHHLSHGLSPCEPCDTAQRFTSPGPLIRPHIRSTLLMTTPGSSKSSCYFATAMHLPTRAQRHISGKHTSLWSLLTADERHRGSLQECIYCQSLTLRTHLLFFDFLSESLFA